MLHSETWALVPVKRFSRAKSRLCEILFERERADLAQTMLRDVLQNLKMTSALDGMADIPLARPRDFGKIIELLEISPVVLVPALYDGGTNALAMRSLGLLRPLFGEESFSAHRSLARQLQLGCSVLKSDRIGKDIDAARIGKDIDSALDFAPYLLSSDDLGLTGSFLEKLNISERFGIDDAPAPLRLI
jgi:2-phospho-L-lactate guanylyltransferase